MTALGGLPAIPGVSCPSAALSLGTAGLGPVCQAASGIASGVVSGVGGVAGSAASQLAGFGVNSVLNALGGWVSAGATWLLGQIGTVIAATTSIDLGASWFTSHYQIMVALAGVIIVPMLLLGIMQSIYRQNASMLMRSVLVNVPLAILLTVVAVKLVQLGLALTDSMSAAIAHGADLDSGHFLASVTLGLSGASAVGQPAAPAFILFVGGLAVVCGALMVWVELLIRAAAVYVAVLFLPLALASLAWPAISHWCRRLVDTLVALVLGKFVIVAVLSLAAGALAGGSGKGGGGFAAVLGGAALLLFAAFAPWALFRLLPFLETGAVGHLVALCHRARQSAAAPARSLAQVAMRATAAGSIAGTATGSMGGLLGGSVARAGAGAGGGGHGGSDHGGSGHGGHSGGLSGPGGDGPPGTRPDPDPSSAESTGVGTTESPGHGIPAWAVHPEASARASRLLNGHSARDAGAERGGEGGDQRAGARGDGPNRSTLSLAATPPRPPALPPPVKPLPRQTGAVGTEVLGRDDLGVRLIAMPAAPPSLPEPAGDDARDPGH